MRSREKTLEERKQKLKIGRMRKSKENVNSKFPPTQTKVERARA